MRFALAAAMVAVLLVVFAGGCSPHAHADWAFSVAVTPDGSQIVSGSGDDTVKVWDLNTGALLRTLTGHTDRVLSVAVTRDGSQIVSGSFDKTLKVWDLNTGGVLRSLTGSSLPPPPQ